jgi:hypothetical protein
MSSWQELLPMAPLQLMRRQIPVSQSTAEMWEEPKIGVN